MAKATKLLPCPFCGLAASIAKEGSGTQFIYNVWCANINCPCIASAVASAKTRKGAIGKWNTRKDTR